MRTKKRGSVCIYEDKKRGTWRVQVTRADRSRTSHTVQTRELAEIIAAHAREQIENQCQTVREAIGLYLRELDKRGRTFVHRETERRKMERMFPREEMLLSELHPIVGQRLYDDLVEAGLAVDTHRNTLNTARSMCQWFVKQRLLEVNPFADVEGVGTRNKGKPQLTEDEAKRWMSTALADPDVRTTAALCCLVLGMRCREIIGLTPRALDRGGAIVRIWRSTTKTSAGERKLEVPECLQDRMPALCATTLVHNQIYRRTHRICKAAGVPLVCPHGLRGTHASLARAAGATGELVSAALGHASTSITEQHYTRQEITEQVEHRAALRILKGGLG